LAINRIVSRNRILCEAACRTRSERWPDPKSPLHQSCNPTYNFGAAFSVVLEMFPEFSFTSEVLWLDKDTLDLDRLAKHHFRENGRLSTPDKREKQRFW